MVTDNQVRRLFAVVDGGATLTIGAARAGMDIKTARRYMRSRKLPSEWKVEHTWRTREDVFAEVWSDVEEKLKCNSGLEAKTLFEDLQRRFPGRFADGQLRTLQRRIKQWRATDGPAKEIFFAQCYEPGERSQSDFTKMNALGVMIEGVLFPHLIYHFVMPRSNWETGTICFSESFEALSEGLQNALWELGRVPRMHQTDRLSAAVNKEINPEIFTKRYKALLSHYGIEPLRIQASAPNENGDVEQRHHRFKRAVDQQLMLRGSRSFESQDAYRVFLRRLFDQLNDGRQEVLAREFAVMRPLPALRIDSCRPPIDVRVTRFSTIRVLGNVYSVDSRLRYERVKVKTFIEHLEVWYAQKCRHRFDRLHGKKKHRIDYRHVIDWLVRKPGAFEHYRYREDLFPTHRFRVAYDELRTTRPLQASRQYLKILELAARESEIGVDEALRHLIDTEQPIDACVLGELVKNATALPSPQEIFVDEIHLSQYDTLLLHCGDGAPQTNALPLEALLP